MNVDDARKLAVAWADDGFAAMPVAISFDPATASTRKRPLTLHGHNSATRAPAELAALFAAAPSQLRAGEVLGVGLRPGPGWIVVDFDTKNGKAGGETLRRLLERWLDLAICRYRSCSGALNAIVRKPEGAGPIANTVPADWHGTDIRADAGWIVAPGTETPWGAWDFDEGSVNPADAWEATADFMRLLTEARPTTRPATSPEVAAYIAARSAYTPATRALVDHAIDGLHAAANGSRHGALVTTLGKLVGLEHVDLGDALGRVQLAWETLTDGEGREREPAEVFAWVLGREQADDASNAGTRAGTADEATEPVGVYFVRTDRVPLERVEFLDEPWFPLRVPTLAVGIDGVGKSTALYTKAAAATRGELNGVFAGVPVDVVIASSEDHPGSVIVPRLIAAGADLEHAHVVKVRRDGVDGDIALPDDLPALTSHIDEVDARLLIVDPLVAHLPLRIDSHKAQHIRQALAPLAHLAELARLAVVCVVHFNGAASTDVRSRISGSKALRDSSRSVLVFGANPADETTFVAVQDKFSFGPRSTVGRCYRIEATTVIRDGVEFPTSKICWLGDVTIDAATLIAGPQEAPDDDRDDAANALREILALGPLPVTECVAQMAEAGFSKDQARRAKERLKVRSIKTGGTGEGWKWTL